MKNKIVIVAIFLLTACSSLRYSKENSYNSYSVKLNSVDLKVENSNFTITPTIFGNRNEFSVISMQSFLNIEVARLLLSTDSVFLIDRMNHTIYYTAIPSNSLKKFQEVLFNKTESKSFDIPLSRLDKLYIKSEVKNKSSILSVKFNSYSFSTEIGECNFKSDKISKPELPRKYEKIPFNLR